MLTKDNDFTGRGNDNEIIAGVLFYLNSSSPVACKSISFSMNGTSKLNDVDSIKIYSTGATNHLDPRTTADASLLGTATPQNGEIVCSTNGIFPPGTNYLWLTYHIKGTATEGDTVTASFLSLTTANEVYKITQFQPQGGRVILLSRKLMYAPGDLGSANYRIPAILTAPDGSIILANDKRKDNQGDLPNDIDVMITRSINGGQTWLAPVTIAQGQGVGKGYGDASLTLAPNGDIICVFVGGPGLAASTPTNPLRTYICRSSNNGQTWTSPKDITDQLYGSGCSDPIRKLWYASFCASGRGLLTHSGRIMLVAAVRETSSSKLSNFVYYSDDNGYTWNVSDRAMLGGDEAKVAELNNGNILMSIRHDGGGARYYNLSSDNGVTWGAVSSWPELTEPGCNGSLIRYTSTKDGYDKNRLLHSIPNDATFRDNVSVFVSYDEGKTWPVKKSICTGSSAYSSLTILPDGTIGAYVEENDPISLYFINFSLSWLTNGVDVFTKPK
ncbi:exo-alpha-sialidase [Microbacter margulisiae]|uniref:exo-alpha-sialidase n=1 Tax=Microbacter margulisiae TaxID=1350067 RepID=A0A7W5DTN3_9PORP|nr:Neuraminidase (sialidase) [Microbacter margulisiae]